MPRKNRERTWETRHLGRKRPRRRATTHSNRVVQPTASDQLGSRATTKEPTREAGRAVASRARTSWLTRHR